VEHAQDAVRVIEKCLQGASGPYRLWDDDVVDQFHAYKVWENELQRFHSKEPLLDCWMEGIAFLSGIREPKPEEIGMIE
jgi:hypothetical protein